VSSPSLLALGVAEAFLAGPWKPSAMRRRAEQATGLRRVWLRDAAVLAHRTFAAAPLDQPRGLARFLDESEPLARGRRAVSAGTGAAVGHWLLPATAMAPAPWPVPTLDTRRDLARWLGLTPSALTWYADVKGLEARVTEERLRHYQRRWVPKAAGGRRLIEEPKRVLKHLQRRVLDEILAAIPAHPAAHGFVAGRSALTHARLHQGQAVVVRVDLADFFAAIGPGRVYRLLRRAGYAEAVAHALTGLATTVTPPAVVAAGGADYQARRRLAGAHLPQGAPTSPALANLVCYGLDQRLAAAARAWDLSYSRYADDLTFSSGRRRGPAEMSRFLVRIDQIVRSEGFTPRADKTVVRRAGQRQQVTGIVVNQRTNLARPDFDALKATLHNCLRLGPASQNRDGHPAFREHLLGRVGWVAQLNPGRGERLAALVAAVDWTA
jgi:RNA-directed DNA polymerase